MAGLQFDAVEIVLVDGDQSARQGARHILFNAGCRKIELSANIRETVQILQRRSPDLMIAELRLADGTLTQLVRKLRQGGLGHNAFMPVFAMVTEAEGSEGVMAALEAGVDDVISKPISTANLMDRINRVINKRRPFVVTEGYIGPKRPQDESAPAVTVPNTLAERLTGKGLDFLEAEMAVTAAQEDIRTIRLQSIGGEMQRLVDQIAPRLEQGELDDGLKNDLNQLLEEAKRAAVQLAGSRFEHVSKLCKSLGGVALRLKNSEPGAVDVRQALLLHPLCQAIQVGFAGGIASEEAATAIVAQIGADIPGETN